MGQEAQLAKTAYESYAQDAKLLKSLKEDMRTCRFGNGDVVPLIYSGTNRNRVTMSTHACANWHFHGIACCYALKVWDVYQSQQSVIPVAKLGRRMREWAVDSKLWFLTAKFREATGVLKTKRIKLSADANLEVDDKLKLTKLRKANSAVDASTVSDAAGTATNPGTPNQNATGIAPELADQSGVEHYLLGEVGKSDEVAKTLSIKFFSDGKWDDFSWYDQETTNILKVNKVTAGDLFKTCGALAIGRDLFLGRNKNPTGTDAPEKEYLPATVIGYDADTQQHQLRLPAEITKTIFLSL
ncbi:unnamed protein product [Bathycoccus prasinos]